jgi:ERCC4-type nuclease
MIIERKTWVDLASSFRDGRKQNIKKLIELRQRTGCQIAYLIEGNATPPIDQLFSRIPVRALRAHLDHLAIRDGVHIMYSKDPAYTALRLFELASNYLSASEIIKDIDKLISNGEEQDNTDELKSKMGVELSINEQILQCLPGVGSLVSTVLAENGITLIGLYNGKYSANDIATLKYPSGAMIGYDRGGKLAYGTKKLIESKAKTAIKIHTKILATIPLISKTTAEAILQHTTLALILSGSIDVELLANIEKSATSKVGNKAAQNILDSLVISEKSTDDTVKNIKTPLIANRKRLVS